MPGNQPIDAPSGVRLIKYLFVLEKTGPAQEISRLIILISIRSSSLIPYSTSSMSFHLEVD